MPVPFSVPDRRIYCRTVDHARFYSHAAGRTLAAVARLNPLALLLFSGSLSVVIIGMSLLTLALFFTEWLTSYWIGNPFFTTVTAAALANTFSQMTFPYLSILFLFQLWLAVGFFFLLQYKSPPPIASASIV